MVQTSSQKYRFFSVVWNVIYIVYAIVHIPILAISLHFAPLVHLNTQLIKENPLIVAFPFSNVVIIVTLCILCIVGLILSTKIRCGMCRVVSMVILAVHASLNILLILIRGAVIAYCIYTITLLARGVIEEPNEGPTSTGPTPTDSDPDYSFVLVYTIIALFLMILSAITELIQVIFSSLVLHQICLEDRKQRKLTTDGDYMKMDPAAEYV